MSFRSALKRLLRSGGFDVIRFNARSSPVARQMKLFRHFGIDLVLDVGANTGGYVSELRDRGYRGRVVSFEPLSGAFKELKTNAARDPLWSVEQVALGQEAGRQEINVAGNSESSSFLKMAERHAAAYPASAYVGTEIVRVERLDGVFSNYAEPGDRVFMKIDTQGYEKHVLEGAADSLPRIVGLQLEMSLVRLYEGESSFVDLVSLVEDLGFRLMSYAPVIDDPETGQLLQVDGLFFRPLPEDGE